MDGWMRDKRRRRYTSILGSARTRAEKTREREREERVLAGELDVGRGGRRKGKSGNVVRLDESWRRV